MESRTSSRPWPAILQTLAALALMFAAYRLVRQCVAPVVVADFSQASFLLAAVVKGAASWKCGLFLVMAAVFALCVRGSSWRGIFPGTRLHWVVWTLIVIMAWTAALYPFNHYHGLGHYADRLVILALGAAALRWAWVFPVFLWAVLVSYLQWRTPMGEPELTNRKLVLDLAFMLPAIGLVLPLARRWLPRAAHAGALAFVCANLIHYWIPGLAKLEVGADWADWLVNDDIFHLTVSTWVHGWNVLWDEAGLVRLYQAASPLGFLLKLYVLVVELALLAAFWSHRVFVLLSLGRVALHAGIFVVSGDTFWNWILLQAAFTAAFWRAPVDDAGAFRLYSWPSVVVSALFVLLTSHSFKASSLGWFDTQLTERYQLHAVMEDGRRLAMNADFFAPYDFLFIQSQFHFLQGGNDGGKVLTRTFGAVHDAEMAARLRGVRTPEAMREMIEKWGRTHPDERKSAGFDDFLRRWMRSHAENSGGAGARVLHAVGPPQHAYVFSKQPPERTYAGERGVRGIEVEFERVLFDGERFHELDRRVVREVGLE